MTFIVHCHPYNHDILFSLGGKLAPVKRKLKELNMTKQDKEWRSRFDDLLMDELTQSILAAWPIELLTKEGV